MGSPDELIVRPKSPISGWLVYGLATGVALLTLVAGHSRVGLDLFADLSVVFLLSAPFCLIYFTHGSIGRPGLRSPARLSPEGLELRFRSHNAYNFHVPWQQVRRVELGRAALGLGRRIRCVNVWWDLPDLVGPPRPANAVIELGGAIATTPAEFDAALRRYTSGQLQLEAPLPPTPTSRPTPAEPTYPTAFETETLKLETLRRANTFAPGTPDLIVKPAPAGRRRTGYWLIAALSMTGIPIGIWLPLDMTARIMFPPQPSGLEIFLGLLAGAVLLPGSLGGLVFGVARATRRVRSPARLTPTGVALRMSSKEGYDCFVPWEYVRQVDLARRSITGRLTQYVLLWWETPRPPTAGDRMPGLAHWTTANAAIELGDSLSTTPEEVDNALRQFTAGRLTFLPDAANVEGTDEPKA